MANIDKTDFIWNGALVWAVNNLYTDLINVDIVKPPYSWWPRNTSFFLQSRLWYIALDNIQNYMHEHYEDWWLDYIVTDVEIVYEDNCRKSSWTVWVVIVDRSYSKLLVLTMPLIEWDYWEVCVKMAYSDISEFILKDNISWELCSDLRLFKTTAPINKMQYEDVVEDEHWASNFYNWIQINRVEWWAMRWYFTLKGMDEDESYRWKTWLIWKYLTVTQTLADMMLDPTRLWDDTIWIPWQTRMIIWYSSDMKYLVLDNAWSWLKVWEKEIKAGDCMWEVFEKERTTFWISLGSTINYASWDIAKWSRELTQFVPTKWNIISTVEGNGRIFALYDNWWVRYSTVWWRDKFMFDDEVFVWEDKIALYSFKDCIIAFWEKRTSVLLPQEENWEIYYYAYEQSATIWLKSRYSFWEHDWNLLFVSNDNRLFAIVVWESTWKYLLEMQDIWQEIINAKLATMLDTDDVFISDYDNELRILVQSKPNPNKHYANNSLTHIYKFSSIFKVWTEDHLENILMNGFKHWVGYWTGWLYIRWLIKQNWSDWVISSDWEDWIAKDCRISPYIEFWYPSTYWPNTVVANCAAYMIENEANGLEWAPNLFNMAKLNRLIVTLWYWKYSSQTKIKITSYREWVWEVTEIPIPETNDWIEMITASYLNSSPDPEVIEHKQCLLESIPKPQKPYEYEEWDSYYEQKVEHLVPTEPWCQWSKRQNYEDHNVSLNSSIYELAPHKPLVVKWISDTQHYSSQIRLEIISESWDLLNFGWFLAELYIAPWFFEWADWENLIEMGSC